MDKEEIHCGQELLCPDQEFFCEILLPSILVDRT